jgi:drug/metabolite transporter (DMT)-like permease
MSNRQKALIALIICVLVWGFSFISIKIEVAVFPPMTLGALRFGIAIILLYFIKRKLAPDEKIRKEDIPLLIGAALSGVTIYFYFENNGVAMITASEASIIIGSIPVVGLIAETVKAKIVSRNKKADGSEIPGEKKDSLVKTLVAGVGAFISLAGVALVAGVSFSVSGNALGYVFMAGACITWVAYCFFTEPLSGRRSRVYIVFWQSVIGFIGFLPFAFFETAKGGGAYWQMADFTVWGHVMFLGVFCSALAYWLYAMSLRDLGVGISTIFINFIPVVSVIGGIFVLDERLQPLQWLGAALVLIGVCLAMKASGKLSD